MGPAIGSERGKWKRIEGTLKAGRGNREAQDEKEVKASLTAVAEKES